MASPNRANRMNFVGYRKNSDLTLSSGVSASNTNRIFRANSDGTWSSYRPDRAINGFTSLTRLRHGTSESITTGSGNVYLLDAADNFNIDEQVPIATVAEGSGSTPSENADDATYIHTISGFDRIPNFALDSGTVVNSNGTGGGNWTTGSTWSGGNAPAAGNIVRIRDGDTVTMNLNATTKFKVVSVENGGTLQFVTDADTQLWCQTLQVRETGTLTIGTTASPVDNGVTARLVITDTAIDTGTVETPGFDPIQYGNGLIVLGTFKSCGFDRGLSYIRVTQERSATDTTITLVSAPTNWQVGDTVAIPDTRQLNLVQLSSLVFSDWQCERRTIDSITDSTITLNSGLTYDHPGPYNDDDELQTGMLWHVMNLTRNVIIESENAAGVRGHCLFSSHADIDIRHTLFLNLARTISDPLNNTTFDGSGNVTNIGTNQIGRYPLHFHHCGGREAQANGWQFTLMGNAIDGGATSHNFKWGYTVHGTHWGLLENNVVYNMFGGGFVLEDGSETGNLLKENMAMLIHGLLATEVNDDAASGFARNGGGFWMRTGLSRFKDNVAASCAAYGMIVNTIFISTINLPTYRGAHFHDGSTTGMVACPGNWIGFVDFDGMEIYGCVSGLTFWWHGSVDTSPQYVTPTSEIKNVKAWHVARYGCWFYPNSNLMFKDWKIYGDASLLTSINEVPIGLQMGDYFITQIYLVNVDIQGRRRAFEDLGHAAENIVFTNCYTRCAIGADLPTPGAAGSAPNGVFMRPHRVIFEDCDLTPTAKNVGGGDKYEIYMRYWTVFDTANLVVSKEIYIYNRNGVEGDDYRVYFAEQSDDFVVLQTSGNLVGCPEAGLTNAQAAAKYEPYDIAVGVDTPVKSDNPNPNTPGLCIANAIAPAGATTPSWTNGLVEEI